MEYTYRQLTENEKNLQHLYNDLDKKIKIASNDEDKELLKQIKTDIEDAVKSIQQALNTMVEYLDLKD